MKRTVLVVILLLAITLSLSAQRVTRDTKFCITSLLEAREHADAALAYASTPGHLPSPVSLREALWMQAMTEWAVCTERRK